MNPVQTPLRTAALAPYFSNAPGNLLKVTEGHDAGKLALLDFGLVAEVHD